MQLNDPVGEMPIFQRFRPQDQAQILSLILWELRGRAISHILYCEHLNTVHQIAYLLFLAARNSRVCQTSYLAHSDEVPENKGSRPCVPSVFSRLVDTE